MTTWKIPGLRGRGLFKFDDLKPSPFHSVDCFNEIIEEVQGFDCFEVFNREGRIRYDK